VIPEGLENVVTLTLVVALYQISDGLLAESGIATVTVAGLVVGNIQTPAISELKEFKEQLTVMFIGMLFVLLAADVRIAEVRDLGWKGIATVAALMFIVRPLDILVCTWGADFNWREKAFLAWIAPRGIVAAAVASLFALSLEQAGIPGGNELRAMVFLVIAVTVLVSGLTGGLVAKLLRLQPAPASGYVLLGANPLGLSVAEVLRRLKQEVLLIDSNPVACRHAEEAGFRVLYGSGLDDRVLARAELEYRAGAIGLTTNDNVNFSFARRTRRESRVPRAWVALRSNQRLVDRAMVEEAGGRVLFGRPRRLEYWISLLGRPEPASLQAWRRSSDRVLDEASVAEMFERNEELLPIAVVRRGRCLLFDETSTLREGDVLHLLVNPAETEKSAEWLEERDFVAVSLELEAEPEPAAP
jgi:Trk K+ transport system NAD-binding subunit